MYQNFETRHGSTVFTGEQSDNGSENAISTIYRSRMAPRVTHFTRPHPTGLGTNCFSTRIQQTLLSTGPSACREFSLANLVHTTGIPIRGSPSAVTTATTPYATNRQRDKRDLVVLNDKFAQYVEKVRFLEAQGRKLNLELNALKARAEQDTSHIKEIYKVEITEANNLVNESIRDAAKAKAKAEQLEDELNRKKARNKELSEMRVVDQNEIDSMQRRIAENEAQIAIFRRRINDLDDEARLYKNETQRVTSDTFRLQNEIQNEKFAKLTVEMEKAALEDELVCLKQTHEAELANLRVNCTGNDLDPSLFFRNELAQAIREIYQDSETSLDNYRNYMHSQYQIVHTSITTASSSPKDILNSNEHYQREYTRMRTEVSQNEDQIAQLREKVTQMKAAREHRMRALQNLQERDTGTRAQFEREMADAKEKLARVSRTYDEVIELKTSLEKEIAVYRRLLEDLRGCVDSSIQRACETSSNTTTTYFTASRDPSPPVQTMTSSVTKTFTRRADGAPTPVRITTTSSIPTNMPNSPQQTQSFKVIHRTPSNPVDPQVQRTSWRDNSTRPGSTISQDNTYDIPAHPIIISTASNSGNSRIPVHQQNVYMEPSSSEYSMHQNRSFDEDPSDELYENIEEETPE